MATKLKNTQFLPKKAQKRPFLAHFDLYFVSFWPFFENFCGHIYFQKWPIGHIFWPKGHILAHITHNWPNKSGQWPDFFKQKWPRILTKLRKERALVGPFQSD